MGRGTVMASLLAFAGVGPPAAATPPQTGSLAERVLAVRDGDVRFAFAPREDVCGDGRGMIRFRDRESFIRIDDGASAWSGKGGRWYAPCLDGPARVRVTVRAGRVSRARVYVGGDWPDRPARVTDLGALAARIAVATLLDLARRFDGRAGDDLVFPAILADSVSVSRDLLDLARDHRAPRASRKAAIFWLSQEAGEAVTRELGDFVASDAQDRELREHAVFALSQLPRDEGVPILIRVARTNRDPEIRRKALFWLGQSEDARALALFEEILTKR
jgi:hypothetical protein